MAVNHLQLHHESNPDPVYAIVNAVRVSAGKTAQDFISPATLHGKIVRSALEVAALLPALLATMPTDRRFAKIYVLKWRSGS